MTREQIDAVLEAVRKWPEHDQEELAELAREIAARREGIYVITEEERAAISAARQSPFVSDDDVRAFWRKHGVL